jgi:hypothetical protein
MLALLIDAIVAWLLVLYVPPGTKRMLLGLLGGWLAAIVGSAAVGLAYGWFAMLSRMTIDLLVHPLLVAGLVWLFTRMRSQGKGEAGPN